MAAMYVRLFDILCGMDVIQLWLEGALGLAFPNRNSLVKA